MIISWSNRFVTSYWCYGVATMWTCIELQQQKKKPSTVVHAKSKSRKRKRKKHQISKNNKNHFVCGYIYNMFFLPFFSNTDLELFLLWPCSHLKFYIVLFLDSARELFLIQIIIIFIYLVLIPLAWCVIFLQRALYERQTDRNKNSMIYKKHHSIIRATTVPYWRP